MEASAATAADRKQLVSSFLEVAVGQTADTATQFLQATGWKLEEAIQLFYVGNEGGGMASSSSFASPDMEAPREQENVQPDQNVEQGVVEDEVRPPLPTKRETLYGDLPVFARLQPSQMVAFRNFNEESRHSAVWESDPSASSTTNSSRENLASLYSPPLGLMYQGSFEMAKIEASFQGKWLLINLQSNEEFSSHMLNRDTWSNEAVAQTIRTNFIFWQVFQDTSEGKKVHTYYNLSSVPAVLVIDPITGQKMRGWSGMVQPEQLLEDLLPYLDKGPKEHHAVLPQKRPREVSSIVNHNTTDKALAEEDEDVLKAIAASMEEVKSGNKSHVADTEPQSVKDAENSSSSKIIYPLLPEEPKGSRELLCRVGIRLPNGRRIQRNFLRTDSIKLLWSFCASQLEDGETRPFHFTQAIPGASKSLGYETNLNFEEAGLSNSVVVLVWN